MRGDATPETPPDPQPQPRGWRRHLQRVVLGVTPTTFAAGVVSVICAMAFVIVESGATLRIVGLDAIAAALALILLAGWGVATSLRTPPQAQPSERLPSIVAWLICAVAMLALVAWAVPQFPSIAGVEIALLVCFLLGLLIRLSDRLRLDTRIARGAAPVLLGCVIAAVIVRLSDGGEPPTIGSAAGPQQLAAAARSGETIRLRGREVDGNKRPAFSDDQGLDASCSRVPIVEVRRSLLGFEELRTEVDMTACWQSERLQSVVVHQYADSPWGSASVEPVLLRTSSVFDADPLAGTTAQSELDAPKYLDTPVAAADVVGDVPRTPGFFGGPPLMNQRGQVNDDANAANDTVLVRVAPDRTSAEVAAAFVVRYPKLQLPGSTDGPSLTDLDGMPAPHHMWFNRFQPRGVELVIAIGLLSPHGGVVRLVHFTDGGPQPWAENFVNY